MEYTKKEREYYNINRERVCNKLGINKNQYNWLRRKGEALRKVYEMDCNGEFIKEDTADRKEGFLLRQVNPYIEKLGLKVYYQTDPRGATLYLDKDPIPENSYTNASCIY